MSIGFVAITIIPRQALVTISA